MKNIYICICPEFYGSSIYINFLERLLLQISPQSQVILFIPRRHNFFVSTSIRNELKALLMQHKSLYVHNINYTSKYSLPDILRISSAISAELSSKYLQSMRQATNIKLMTHRLNGFVPILYLVLLRLWSLRHKTSISLFLRNSDSRYYPVLIFQILFVRILSFYVKFLEFYSPNRILCDKFKSHSLLRIFYRIGVLPGILFFPNYLGDCKCDRLSQSRKFRSLTIKKFDFVMIGSLIPIKNHLTALKAVNTVGMKLNQELKVCICGSGVLHQSLVDYSEKSSHISLEICQYSSIEELINVLSVSRFSIVPSKSENFCLAAAEFLYSGIPLVISTTVGLLSKSLINQNSVFTFKYHSRVELETIIYRLLTSKLTIDPVPIPILDQEIGKLSYQKVFSKLIL